MEPYFTRITCWIEYKDVPPVIEKNYLGFYESTWDVRTNTFIKDNLEKINAALETYPSAYCYYQMHYVPQPQASAFSTDEEKWSELDKIAEEQREETDEKLGVIYCSLFQDRGHENPRIQRVLIFNVEDNTPEAILAAIRYMGQLADQLKKEVMYGSGTIPYRYSRPWKVDLAVEHKDLYDSAFDWLEGKNEMYFVQPILKYDDKTHRLWFMDNQGNIDDEFGKHDLLSQAFYVLVWNHPEGGVKDSDLYYSANDDSSKKERVEALKEEFAEYYRILNDKKSIEEARKQVDFFCKEECRDVRNTARSRIKKAFFTHEKNRVNMRFAQKVADYYSFGADGTIKVINRSTTILLPDFLMSDRLKKYNAEHANDANK